MLLFATAAKSSSSSAFFFIIIVVYAVAYFAFIRPRSRKAKAARTQSKQVEIGERARTIGGLIGTIVRRNDESVTLRTASGVELDFIPSAIAGRVDPVPTVDDDLSDHDEDHEDEGHSHEGDEK
ncbi:MAG TPA: preprotein translocase subunit YajC [Acidimicrobiales bacterium]